MYKNTHSSFITSYRFSAICLYPKELAAAFFIALVC